MITKKYQTNQQGFTIIELLIATAVFSVVLLILTFGVLQITDSYYRGVTQANTQNADRNIINDISQAIQFGGGDVINGSGYYCVGSQRYSYVIGKELESGMSLPADQTPHALVVDSVPGCSSSTGTQNLNSTSISGQELLSPNMRLAAFSITAQPGNPLLYKVDVRVLYGDSDLLTADSGSTATCEGGSGSQFCAVSELSTIVERRVQ